MRGNIENVKRIIVETIARLPEKRGCECGGALKGAFV
jgi:hypothetical protein